MIAKIIIKRRFVNENRPQILSLLNKIRTIAMDQPGYLSGETLANHYDTKSVTVISTWQSVEDWIRWQESEERASNEAQIENLLDRPTLYEVYDIVSSSR